MATITYLDGSQLTSTALTDNQTDLIFQVITAQMLGLTMFQTSIAFTENSNTAIPANMNYLAVGQLINSPSLLPRVPAATIIEVGISTITISVEASVTITEVSTIYVDSVSSSVRIGWQIEGQPGPSISSDTVTILSTPIDSEYGRMRDVVRSVDGSVITNTDVFTRAWKIHWTFYGPDGLDNARAIRSALDTIQFVADFLATYNLYVNPSIPEPLRGPREFQGRWWERLDLEVEFNEQITETFTVGIVESVEVQLFTKDGLQNDFTVEL